MKRYKLTKNLSTQEKIILMRNDLYLYYEIFSTLNLNRLIINN